jgi:hypothetical protein
MARGVPLRGDHEGYTERDVRPRRSRVSLTSVLCLAAEVARSPLSPLAQPFSIIKSICSTFHYLSQSLNRERITSSLSWGQGFSNKPLPTSVVFTVSYHFAHCSPIETHKIGKVGVELTACSRPGILVLINDADWELEGEATYALQPNDNILFVSTLHGG